jgi:hypothetical protein
MDGNTFGVRGSTSYYVKGVGYIDLNVGIDSNKEFYLEGSKGDASVRISSMGDVKLTYGDVSVEVNKDFTVGISGGKVTAEARAGAAGSVKVNGVEVGVSTGGSLNAGVDRSGKITLGGGFNTKINVGGYELKFQAGGSVTLDAGGAVEDIGNMMVKLKDGTYKKLSGAMDSLFNAGGDLLSDINKTLSNIFKPPKIKIKWGW